MIESKYNYTLNENNSVFLLNGMSGYVIKLEDEEYNFLRKIFADPELQAKNPLIAKKLIEKGFLVTDDQQELNKLKEEYWKSKNNGFFKLTLNPTQNCNFNCWYCYESHPRGYMTDEVVRRIEKLIVKTLKRKETKFFFLDWFGGEPLMYFHKVVYGLSAFAKKEAAKNGVDFANGMTTNGYLLTEKVIEKAFNVGLNFLQITLDGDRETHDSIRNNKGKPSFDRIICNCIKFCRYSSNNKITLRINYTDESLKIDYAKILDVIPPGIRKQIKIDFQRVWQTLDKKRNIEKGKKLLSNNRNALMSNHFVVRSHSNFSMSKGCVCYADRSNYVNINYDGQLYRCTATSYSPDNALGVLGEGGEILWKESTIHDIDEKPFFENDKCISCRYLPLCGGPCYSKIVNYKKSNKEFCVLDKIDTDINHFIKEYYLKYGKR